MIAAILLFATLSPAQTPKAEKPVVGRWKLKSVTVDEKPASAKQLSGLLKKAGGVKLGMIYKFRGENAEKETTCALNDVEAGFSYDPKIREIYVESGETGHEFELRFDVTFVGKEMKLRFKEKEIDKDVEMLFTPN